MPAIFHVEMDINSHCGGMFYAQTIENCPNKSVPMADGGFRMGGRGPREGSRMRYKLVFSKVDHLE